MTTRSTQILTVVILLVLASPMALVLGGATSLTDTTATSESRTFQETETPGTQQTQNESALTIDELEIETLYLRSSTVRNGQITGITAENVSGTSLQNQAVTFERMTGTVRIHDVTLENVTIRNDSLASELALGQTHGQLGEISIPIATLSNQTIDGVHIESGSVENVTATGFTQESATTTGVDTGASASPPAFEATAASIGDVHLVNTTVIELQVTQSSGGAETTATVQNQTSTATG